MIKSPGRFLAATLLLLAVVGLSSCSRSPSSSSQDKPVYPGTITIGTVVWPGYIALYIARDKGYFREAGLNVELKNYAALSELSQDYAAGKMQGRANLNLDAVIEKLKGLDHQVVLAIDYSNGADGIATRSDIQSLADVKGKRVGLDPNTLEEFFMAWALEQNSSSLKDVTVIPADPEKAPQLLKAGEVDVAVTYEPFLSQLLADGQFHTIYSSSDAPGLIADLLTFRTEFIQAYPETVEAFIRAYFRALRFWKEHPEEALVILAKELNDTPEGTAKQLKGLHVLDENDNRTAFTFAAGLQSLYGNLRHVAQFVGEHQAGTTSPLDSDALIDRTFIKAITQN